MVATIGCMTTFEHSKTYSNDECVHFNETFAGDEINELLLEYRIDHEWISSELLRPPKPTFQKPVDMGLPKINIPIKPTNRRLSMFMRRHNR